MTKSDKTRLFYGIFLSIFTVVVGLLFVVEAADIYYSGTEVIYSREIVAQRLKWLAAPVALWIVAIVVGFVLSVKTPEKFSRPQDPRRTLSLLSKKYQIDGEEARLYQKTRLWGIIAHAACGVFCVVAAVFCIVYLADATHFTAQSINGEILQMLAHILPWVLAAFVVCVALCVVDGICAKSQLTLLKKAIAQKNVLPAQGGKDTLCAIWQSPKMLWSVRGALLAVGLALVILGAVNGGAKDVLIKSVNICTECIGLG